MKKIMYGIFLVFLVLGISGCAEVQKSGIGEIPWDGKGGGNPPSDDGDGGGPGVNDITYMDPTNCQHHTFEREDPSDLNTLVDCGQFGNQFVGEVMTGSCWNFNEIFAVSYYGYSDHTLAEHIAYTCLEVSEDGMYVIGQRAPAWVNAYCCEIMSEEIGGREGQGQTTTIDWNARTSTTV